MTSGSGRIRSKTGCLTCKKRRKKCDETRPTCERCTKAGMECLGYSYLETSDQKYVQIRSKAAVRLAAARSPKADDSDNTTRPSPPRARNNPSTPASAVVLGSPSSVFAQSSLLPLIPGMARENVFPTANEHVQSLFPGFAPNDFPMDSNIFDFSFLSPAQSALPFSPQLGGDAGAWDTSLALGGLGYMNSADHMAGLENFALGAPAGQSVAVGSSTTPEGHQLPVAPDSTTHQAQGMTSGQASLFNALFSLGEPAAEPSLPTPGPSHSTDATPPGSQASTWPSPDTERDDEDSVTSEESDPEGVKEIVCGTPALDRTVESNSLPFVLQGYAHFITRTVYEPLRLAHKVRDWVTERYSYSGDSRNSVTMFAGLLNSIWRRGATAADYIPIASILGKRVRQRVIETGSGLDLASKSDAEISKALDEANEMITVQCLTSPMTSALGLLIDTAPLFRRLCPEPPHEFIYLPSVFMHPDIGLRHFASMDIIMAASLSRPMLFQYNVYYDRDLCDGISISEDMGLQWLNGIPDQIMIMLARMNMLRDDFAPNVDPIVVAEIEQELKDFQSEPSPTTDAYLMIARLAVQECWRLVMFIYLYMGLCGADAKDPRVEKAHKGFMRLFERTKPGRTPDAFLIIPMLLAGVATSRQRERNLIRQRMLAVQECANPGTCGNDGIRVLEDIWARTSAEGRPSVWGDLRISVARIMGV